VPAVAEIRVAVRRLLAAERPDRVLVACSGGADSVALAAATAFEAPRIGIPAGLVTVDHRLQPGSAKRAEAVADLGRTLGLDPVLVLAVDVGTGGGPEAAARDARYAALRGAALEADPPSAAVGEPGRGRVAVLLGHTLDDQAETVLLGLGRGSGPRSIAGMRVADGLWLRPLLGARRSTTRAACVAESLPVWDDPHNADPRFTRSRLRSEVLPLLDEVLAGGVAEALARTADLVRADLDALDVLAAAVTAAVVDPPPALEHPEAVGGTGAHGSTVLDAVALAAHPPAIRTRVLRSWLGAAGVPPVTSAQLRAVDALVADWHGQGPVALPSGLAARRRSGRLHVARPDGS